MTEITDQDWDLLSAYADGALQDVTATRLKTRLTQEPDLRDALVSIREMSVVLSAMRPVTGGAQRPAGGTLRPVRWIGGVAVAASIALAAVVGALSWQHRPSDIHITYVEQSFPMAAREDLHRVTNLQMDGFPSLGEADMTLVVTNTVGAVGSAHYIGKSGCRLTLLRGSGAPPKADAALQSAQWVVGARWYQTLATGMDPVKFAALTRYLRQTTRAAQQPAAELALQGAVQGAAPCA